MKLVMVKNRGQCTMLQESRLLPVGDRRGLQEMNICQSSFHSESNFSHFGCVMAGVVSEGSHARPGSN